MGLTNILRDKTVYDGKRLWETYMEWGRGSSHKRLREWARENNMVNPWTGKVSQMGAFWAMWRYAVHNPEEAYESYKKHTEEFPELIAMGISVNFEFFLKDVQKHARNEAVVSRKTYREFCKKHNLEE